MKLKQNILDETFVSSMISAQNARPVPHCCEYENEQAGSFRIPHQNSNTYINATKVNTFLHLLNLSWTENIVQCCILSSLPERKYRFLYHMA